MLEHMQLNVHICICMNVDCARQPKTIVLCASWKKAQEVYELVEWMLPPHLLLSQAERFPTGGTVSTGVQKRRLRVCALFGGSGESDAQMALRLSQGVDILVATPRTFEHLLHSKGDFSRLRHLVLDDADELFDKSFDSVCYSLLHFLFHLLFFDIFLSYSKFYTN